MANALAAGIQMTGRKAVGQDLSSAGLIWTCWEPKNFGCDFALSKPLSTSNVPEFLPSILGVRNIDSGNFGFTVGGKHHPSVGERSWSIWRLPLTGALGPEAFSV